MKGLLIAFMVRFDVVETTPITLKAEHSYCPSSSTRAREIRSCPDGSMT